MASRTTSMTISEARARLPELVTRVDAGEEVIITRHGRPLAVMVRPDEPRSGPVRRALADAEAVHQLLVSARAHQTCAPDLSTARADELIRAIRVGREAR